MQVFSSLQTVFFPHRKCTSPKKVIRCITTHTHQVLLCSCRTRNHELSWSQPPEAGGSKVGKWLWVTDSGKSHQTYMHNDLRTLLFLILHCWLLEPKGNADIEWPRYWAADKMTTACTNYGPWQEIKMRHSFHRRRVSHLKALGEILCLAQPPWLTCLYFIPQAPKNATVCMSINTTCLTHSFVSLSSWFGCCD